MADMDDSNFEDDFEPYETSNDEAGTGKGTTMQTEKESKDRKPDPPVIIVAAPTPSVKVS